MNLLPAYSQRLPGHVYCEDALDLLRAMPDCSIDAIISDPPYNMTELAFEQAIDWSAFWMQARRVLRSSKSPVILFSQQPFTSDLISSNRCGFRNEIIYEKTMAVGFLNANRRPLQAHENMLVFAEQEPDYIPQMEIDIQEKSGIVRKRANNAGHYGEHDKQSYTFSERRYPRSVWRFAQRHGFIPDTEHPTQKPLALMERLILTYTHPGWLIVDPFCGSGSTLLAAQVLGREFIGGDLSSEYVDMARRRLAAPWTPLLFPEVAAREPQAVTAPLFEEK